MELPMGKCLYVLVCIFVATATFSRPVSSSPTCQREYKTFLHHLNSQCPFSIPRTEPILVDGELYERAIRSGTKNEYTAVLFYASWCPFSSIFQSKFSALSSMYPQVKHLMVEQTSVLPSVFSEYGIHSVPSLMIVDHTARVRYHGRKDLQSLVNFYRSTTGLDPVVDMVEDPSLNPESDRKAFNLWDGASSFKELFSREPYLALSIVFVLSRAFFYLLSEIAPHIVAIWIAYTPHLNMAIFGDSRQLINRVLHLFNVKRIWNKLKLCKSRNFHRGARNARVWASSLASVSLGETPSSSRGFAPRDM